MRVGSVEMQPKMAEGAALFRPTIFGGGENLGDEQ
jgi:hypothetical protein